ncbi:hypothetical protein ACIRP7_17020 [Streptomyces sp. NPDC102270]|uniref:hypothetical protein n=1 Tax=Streptomyces sp. NPDC102270 TaxID=3366150 RepID=UPI0037FC181D
MLAAVVDHLAVANWMFATVHRDEDAEPAEYPEAVPRPSGAETEAMETPRDARGEGAATPAEIVAFLSAP